MILNKIASAIFHTGYTFTIDFFELSYKDIFYYVSFIVIMISCYNYRPFDLTVTNILCAGPFMYKFTISHKSIVNFFIWNVVTIIVIFIMFNFLVILLLLEIFIPELYADINAFLIKKITTLVQWSVNYLLYQNQNNNNNILPIDIPIIQ
jgi:hypothetical protein